MFRALDRRCERDVELRNDVSTTPVANATSASLCESLLQDRSVFEIVRYVNLEGDVVSRIVLSQHLAEKFRRIEEVFRKVFPEKLAASDDPSFTHCEELQREPRAFSIESEDVHVAIGCRRHFLLLAKRDDRPMQIAIACGDLELSFVRELPHTLLEIPCEFFIFAFEQNLHIACGFLIFILCAQSLDARPEAPLEMILETRTRQLAIDIDLACAKLERAIDEI